MMWGNFADKEYKRPVLFSGSSYASRVRFWVVDGYLNRTNVKEEVFKYYIVEQSDDGTITSRYEDIPSTTRIDYHLLHINWGIEGRSDGYYASNIFNTNKEMVENSDGYF